MSVGTAIVAVVIAIAVLNLGLIAFFTSAGLSRERRAARRDVRERARWR